MTVGDLNNIFKLIFNKNLHVTLQLSKDQKFSKEFLEEYAKKYMCKEIPITNLENTVLGTNRWEYYSDLSVVLYSIPIFNQKKSVFETEIILYADIESKVKNYSAHTLLSLLRFIKPENRSDYFEYIEGLKTTWKNR